MTENPYIGSDAVEFMNSSEELILKHQVVELHTPRVLIKLEVEVHNVSFNKPIGIPAEPYWLATGAVELPSGEIIRVARWGQSEEDALSGNGQWEELDYPIRWEALRRRIKWGLIDYKKVKWLFD